MTRSLRSYLTLLLAPALIGGLCACGASTWGADAKDSKQVEVVDTAAPAAARDGLEVRMASPKKFVEGEPLKIAFKFTNVAREGNFALYNKLFDSQYSDDRDFDKNATIVAVHRETQESFTAVCEAEICRAKGSFTNVALKPGQSWEGQFVFSRHIRFKNTTRGERAPQLPPGPYRMTVTWKFEASKSPPVEGSSFPWWTGALETKPFEFEVAKPAN